jgi:hypothetical protein
MTCARGVNAFHQNLLISGRVALLAVPRGYCGAVDVSDISRQSPP